MIIKGLTNVIYDDASTYTFDVLNESLFLEETFTSLSQLMKDEFEDYLFFILSTHDSSIVPSSIKHETKKKKILIFISEESGALPQHLSQHYFAIFKAYLKADKIIEKNIFNFSLGCVSDVPQLPIKPLNSRKYFVFFTGSLNDRRMPFYFSFIPWLKSKKLSFLSPFTKQQKILVRLKSNFSKKFPNSYIQFTTGFKEGLSPQTYGQMMANSKIVLCPTGAKSPESFRHNEAMRAGCVIISEKLPNNPFYQNSPIIQIDNWADGFQRTSELLKNEVELENISNATQVWWREKCSSEAVSRFVYSSIQKVK